MSKSQPDQRDSNRILMSTFGWPEEIQEFPKIAEPPEEEPIQRTCKDECAIFYDIDAAYVTGRPYTVEQ